MAVITSDSDLHSASLALLSACNRRTVVERKIRKINRTRHLLELGRLLTWRAELYDLSGVQRSGILQRLPKVLRYIKLNYLCHDHLLLYEPLWRGWDAQRSDSNGPTKPIRIGNARTRAIGACAGVLCKWRMISST